VKLGICMFLRPDFKPAMRIVPQIGVCTHLRKMGHEVTWVIWSDDGQNVQPYSIDAVRIHEIPWVRIFPGMSLLAKSLNIIPSIIRRTIIILKLLKSESYDLIFVRDFALDGLIAAYIKRRYKVPFVFALSNPLEQEWEQFKIERQGAAWLVYLITRFNKSITKYLLRRADLILPISKWVKEQLISDGLDASKIMPYPDGVDIEYFSMRDGTRIRHEYNLGKMKIILYTGTLGKPRGLSVLIEAFALARRKIKNIKLLMLGTGSDEENLRRLCIQLGIEDDVIFVGQVPQSEVPDYIAAADIGVSPLQPNSFLQVCSPIKLFEYMALARPVIANREIFEQKEVIEESGAGILVTFAADAFADAIVELLEHPEESAEMGKKGRRWVIKNRSYGVLASQLESRFVSLFPP